MTHRLLLYTALALCLPLKMPAQELFFRHFTIDDGLPSNEVHSIREDSAGLLWLATDRGIMRYDGYTFREVRVTGAPPVYPWLGIYKDQQSATLYFLGLRGDIAVCSNGTAILHPYNEALKQYHNGTIASSFLGRRDSIWVNYGGDGLLLLTPAGRIIQRKDMPGFHFDVREGLRYVIGKWEDKQRKQPLFITWPDGRVTTDSVLLPESRHLDFLWHERIGDKYFFATGIQLSCYRDTRKLWQVILPTDILSFQSLDDRQVLIGLRNGGVGLYNMDSSGMLHGPVKSWLKDLSVTNIHHDRQGGLWFTTIENGLFYAHPTLASYYTGPGQIIFIASRKGRTYACYQSGMIHVLQHGELLRQKLQLPLERNEHPAHYTFNASGELMVITNRHLYTARESGEISRANLSAPPRQWEPPPVQAGDTGSYDYLFPALPAFFTSRITGTHRDGQGRLWIGTYDGLYLYRDDSLVSFTSVHPAFSDRIVGLGTLSGKWLAVATMGNGLILYRDGRIYTPEKEHTSQTTIINDMEIDGDTIWMGTNRGISKVLFINDSFRAWHYGAGYGLPTLGIHQLSVSDGWIYFNWINRLVAIEKKRLQRMLPAAAPLITHVVVSTSDTCSLAGADLRHDQNTIKIGFTNTNLANGPGQVYRYRLEGFDKEWHTTTERQAIFVNLPPGNFTFVAEVADAQGAFLSPAARYHFIIHPAFWQQWWFPYAVGLLLLLIAVMVFMRHLRSLKNQSRLLLDLAENQQKALVQLINPHFIFNVLNTFSSAVATEDRMNALIIISRFTRLIRMSIELGRKKNVLLSEEIALLEKYLELETIRFPGKFSYNISVGAGIDPHKTVIPTMLIQPFVENAVKHGIMHLFDRKGSVMISFALRDSLILCTVEDNGVGRMAAAQINRRKEVPHEPAGIPITLHRLQLLHKERQKDYIYRITDMQDETGRPAGTKVMFSMPYTLKTK